MNFSPRMLDAFLTLAHLQHFTLAAKRMHMSQSAFSQAISRLEIQIGVKLFDRSTRNVSLTPEGELLLPVAKRLTRDMDLVVRDLKDHVKRRQGKVAIAAPPGASAEWMPQIIARFRALYPAIQVRLFDVPSDTILELIRDRTVDFGVNREVGSADEFEAELLLRDPHFLVCRPQHRLARKASVRLSDLAGEEYLYATRYSSLWQRLHPLLERVAIKDNGQEFAYPSTAAGLIANGLGVTIVAGQSVFNFLRLGLVAVPVAEPELDDRVYLLRRQGQELSMAARALQELIKATVPEKIARAARATA